jgi:hypothetical protein
MSHLSAAFQLASALCVLLLPSPADAQDTARVPSQVLLKRLAEAVDGHRHGRTVYIVARNDSLAEVVGVFENRVQAVDDARRRGSTYGVFGGYKYVPPPSPLPQPRGHDFPEIVLGGCIHDGKRSAWRAICPQDVLPLSSVDSLSLVVRLKDGTTRRWDLGTSTDAVFLSQAAIDKFAIPYYARILGVEAAAAMRGAILAGTARLMR